MCRFSAQLVGTAPPRALTEPLTQRSISCAQQATIALLARPHPSSVRPATTQSLPVPLNNLIVTSVLPVSTVQEVLMFLTLLSLALAFTVLQGTSVLRDPPRQLKHRVQEATTVLLVLSPNTFVERVPISPTPANHPV